MRIMLDTHILLWWVGEDRRLPGKARRIIENASNDITVSVASIWELAIKRALGRMKIDLQELEDVISANDFEPLAVKWHHTVEVAELPTYHNDPFDRMLIAQCLTETMYLLTHDSQLQKYGKVVMVV
jgi:PIN domain nuclease of toxin-antitoxin system